MKVTPLKKSQFLLILNELKVQQTLDFNFLYDVYETSCDAIEELSNLTKLNTFTPVNHIVLILYVINETIFAINNVNNDKEKIESDDFFDHVASVVSDKYITNEQLNYKSGAFLSRFNPLISTIELYSNFILQTLSHFEPQLHTRADALVKDMLERAFKMIKCIASLLIDGFETEAFSTWRTLHENECILICLLKYPDPLFKLYFKHISYALAYRGQFGTKEETDEVFVQIKDEMKKYELKSKDMKKYIEYGYLFGIPGAKLNETFKLNFRDGVEKMADLESYSKVYEQASEIAHSSPLLLYSKRDYYFNITMLNLYESFFRLESVFSPFYLTYIKGEEAIKYRELRNIYINELRLSYNNLKGKLLASINKEQNGNN